MASPTIARGLVLAAVTAATAVAQIAGSGAVPSVIVTPNGVRVAAVGGAFVGGGPSNRVTGQPYSAQQETQTIQTLSDGTHITSGAQKVMYYRDSLGRTRTELTPTPMPGFLGTSTPPVFIEIADPVGGYRYSFDSNSHTAHRAPFGPAGRSVTAKAPAPPALAQTVPGIVTQQALASAGGANTQRPRPDVSSEQLGSQSIEGVLAEGTRTTTTWPVGLIGNDRPLTAVTETWFSREIGTAVLTKTSDPRNGKTTIKLTNISLAEPDPSLFQPPADYEIVDPSGQPAVSSTNFATGTR